MCCEEGNWQIATGQKAKSAAEGGCGPRIFWVLGRSQARVPVPQVLKGSLDLRFESKADMEE
jgi:hypothetical protein